MGLIVVYTGDGKGKTSAGLGLAVRALGAGMRVAVVQFMKAWPVSEDAFLAGIAPQFAGRLFVYKGGRGFYRAGSMSARGVSDAAHRQAARRTLAVARRCASSGAYDLVVADECAVTVHCGLLPPGELARLIRRRAAGSSLCITGRSFPVALMPLADVVTVMEKRKHCFDAGVMAQPGIDY